jgi:hypothetical protein
MPSLSYDFSFLLDTTDYLSIMLLLRDQWSFYEKWIATDQNAEAEAAKVKLRENISTTRYS